jgi:Ca2+-binding RTX toxin-like protein
MRMRRRLVGAAAAALIGAGMMAVAAQTATSCDGAAVTKSGTVGNDFITGTSGADVIDGLAGNDQVNGLAGGDRICGGDGDDSLRGGDGNDRLFGGRGSDGITGGLGADVMSGENVSYIDHSAPVTVTIDGAANDGASGERDNVRTDVRNVFGGAGSDRLVGNEQKNVLQGSNGNDALEGLAGDDRLVGGSGADRFTGGTGEDTVSYGTVGAAVSISADGVANDGVPGEGDNVGTDVERLEGGPANDRITGSDAKPTTLLSGGGGNDVLNGGFFSNVLDGGPGSDDISGGNNSDTVTYEVRSNPVVVTLDGVRDDGESGEKDLAFPDVENIRGGRGADQLIGNSLGNTIEGGPGNDTILGLGGFNRLIGGPGAEDFSPGPGSDTVSYDDHTVGVTVTTDGVANDGAASEGDNVRPGIESIDGSPADDTMTGGDGAEDVDGREGNDTLTGGLGEDSLNGSDGDDTIFARDGVRDSVDCGLGVDRAELDLQDTFDVFEVCESVDQGAIREGPNVRFLSRTMRVGRDGRVRVALRCPRKLRSPCAGRLALERIRRKRKGSKRKRTKRLVRTKLGVRSYRIRTGRRRVVTVTLSGKGRRLLARSRRVVVTATSVERGEFGPKTTVRPLTLRAPSR